MDQIIYPFTIDEVDVNLLDTVAYSVCELPQSSQILVPTRLELTRKAGTAYALGVNTDGTATPRRDRVASHPQLIDRNFDFDAKRNGQFLVLREMRVTPAGGSSAEQVTDLLHVPFDGFLNQTAQKGIVVFPNLNGRTFEPGAYYFELLSQVPISGGTGDLVGTLYFNTFTVG